jgi:hypothetical protein
MSMNNPVIVPSEPERKAIKRGSFNQLIAKTHRLNNQLIGLQLTMGNLIAVCLSAAQITAGVVGLLWASAGWGALLVVFVCFPLAVVIERLSLGGLMIFRTASKELRKIEEAHHMKLLDEKRDATEREEYELERQRKRLNSNKLLAWPIIIMGVLISGGVGDQFWSKVFGSVGGWEAIVLPLACAVAISLTFVFSELYKELADDGLVELVSDSRIARAVLANEETDIQIDLALKAFSNFRQDPRKNDREVGKIEKVIGSRVTAFADYVEERGLGTVQVGPAESDMKQIEAKAASKRRFEDCKDDLEWLLQRNPNMSLQAMANKFGVSKSTIREWIKKLNPGS